MSFATAATTLFSCMMGTYSHWVLLFAWVLLFRKWKATGLIGTYIHRVLVIDGSLYSRVYGILYHLLTLYQTHSTYVYVYVYIYIYKYIILYHLLTLYISNTQYILTNSGTDYNYCGLSLIRTRYI